MNDGLKHTERRHFARAPLRRQVQVSCNGREFATDLLNISLKGALLKTPENWHELPRCPCSLALALDNAEQTQIQMQGYVLRQDSQRLGFYCEHIDWASIAHLRRLIELNLEEDTPLEGEVGDWLQQPSET